MFLIEFHSIPFHSNPFHSIPNHSIPFHSIPFQSNPFHSIPFHSMFYPMPNRRHLIRTQMNTPRVEPFNPKVLAQPAQPETATSLSPDTPVTALPQSNHTNTTSQQRPPNMPYITRSGREVKINRRYNDDNWITN